MIILIIHIIVSYDQNNSLIILMWKMDPMPGWNIRLVFTLPPRENTLQYKRCVHFWNNFPGIKSLPLPGPLLGPLKCTVPRQHLSYSVFLPFSTTTQLQFPTQVCPTRRTPYFNYRSTIQQYNLLRSDNFDQTIDKKCFFKKA